MRAVSVTVWATVGPLGDPQIAVGKINLKDVIAQTCRDAMYVGLNGRYDHMMTEDSNVVDHPFIF